MIFFSAETGGFYPASMKAEYDDEGRWPADIVELTQVEKDTFWKATPPEGHQLGTDESGRPKWIKTPPIPAKNRREVAKRSVDRAAGNARSSYITTVPGQESTYQLKADEANAYITANRPEDASAYPMLSAEAEGRGTTVSDLADEILATRTKWVQAAAQIEKARVSGKAAVDAAPDDSDFDAVAKPYIDALNVMKP